MNRTRAAIFLAIIVVVILQAAGPVAGGIRCDRILNCNTSVIHGRISSPRFPLPYPTNISCTWIIKSPLKTYIRLVIKKVSIRNTPTCADHVTIRYAGPSPYRYCYSIYSSVGFYSPNNEMIVKFTAGTGNNTVRQGFFAEFNILKAVCSKQNLTSRVGRLMSPNYPHQYPGNLTCQWVIRVPQGYHIHLVFHTMMLQKNNLCKSDYVLVMDGSGSAVHIMKRFCREYHSFISSGNVMTVRFVSDLLFTNKGFYASYSAIAPYATSPTPMTASSTSKLGRLPSQTIPLTSSLPILPSKTINVVPKQTPTILPDNLIGMYQVSYGVANKHSYINRLKMTSKIACVLKCQQTLACKAAIFSCHGDENGDLCTLYDSSLQHKPDKRQQISGDMYYEQIRFIV